MATEKSLTVAAPLTVSIGSTDADWRRHAVCARQGTLSLTIAGARLVSGQSGGVLVFLNKPDATARTSPADPHYAGSFDFFPVDRAAHDFTVDLAPAFARAAKSGRLAVTLVALPHPSGKAPAEIHIAALRLGDRPHAR